MVWLRIRRWVVRPFFWSLAAIAFVALCLRGFLASEFVRERLAARLEQQLSQILRRNVQIGRLDFELLPFAVRIEDFSISGPGPKDPALLSIRRLRVDADLDALRHDVIDLQTVSAQGVRLHLELYPGGRDNLPDLKGGGGESRFQLRIGGLFVEDGEFELADQRVPLAVEAHALLLQLSGLGGTELQGNLTAQEVVTTLPKALPWASTLTAKVRLRDDRVEILQARLLAPDFDARVAGFVGWRGGTQGEIRGVVETQGTLLDDLGYLSGEIAGPLRFEGDVRFERKEIWYGGRLTSPGGRALRLPARRARGRRRRRRARKLDDRPRSRTGDLRRRPGLRPLRGRSRPGRSVGAAGPAGRGAPPPRGARRSRAARAGLLGLGARRPPLRVSPERRPPGSGLGIVRTAPGAAGPAERRWGRAGRRPGGSEAGRRATRADAGRARFGGATDRAHRRLRPRRQDRGARGRGRERRPRRAGPSAAVRRQRAAAALAAGHRQRPGDRARRPGRRRRPRRHRHPIVDLELDLADFHAPGVAAARARGSLTIDATAVRDLELTLTRGAASLRVAGVLPLAPASPAARSAPAPPPLALDVEFQAWPVAEAGPWLPFPLPLAGEATGALHLGGSLDELTGDLRGSVSPVTVAGLDFDRLETSLDWDADRLRLRQLRLSAPAGLLAGSGELLFAGERLDFELTGERIDLAALPLAGLAETRLRGHAALVARLSGTVAEPRLVVDAEFGDLELPGPGLAGAGSCGAWPPGAAVPASRRSASRARCMPSSPTAGSKRRSTCPDCSPSRAAERSPPGRAASCASR